MALVISSERHNSRAFAITKRRRGAVLVQLGFGRVASDEFSPAFERRGNSPPQGFAVALATAEYRRDSSVANATLHFRNLLSQALKSRAKLV